MKRSHIKTVVFVIILGLGYASAGCVTDMTSATGQRINLESFVPDPACWLRETSVSLAKYKISSFSESLGKGLLMASAAISFIRAIATKSWQGTMMRFIFLAMGFTFINGYSNNMGPGVVVANQFMKGWQEMYAVSSQVANAELNATVIQGTKAISSSIFEYTTAVSNIRLWKASYKWLGTFRIPPHLTACLTSSPKKNKSV